MSEETDAHTRRDDDNGPTQRGVDETASPHAHERTSRDEAGDPAQSPRARLFERINAARKLVRAEWYYFVALAAFAALALAAHAYAYFAWDLEITRALQSLPIPGLLAFMRFASIFADASHGWTLTAVVFVAFLARRRRTEAFALLLSVAGGTLINRFVKSLVGRPRPVPALVHVSGEWARESFPSGHVTFYVCFFGFLFFAAYALLRRGTHARRAALTLTALPVLVVGASRVYLGAHWTSDVLGAYLLSGIWLAFTLHLYQRWKARSTFHQEEVKEVVVSEELKETDAATRARASQP